MNRELSRPLDSTSWLLNSHGLIVVQLKSCIFPTHLPQAHVFRQNILLSLMTSSLPSTICLFFLQRTLSQMSQKCLSFSYSPHHALLLAHHPSSHCFLWLFCLQCITDTLRARGINVSTSLPDDVLDFVRRHPLMSQQVQPSDRRPLLFRRTTDYTHMAVHMIQGLDGRIYHVLYMGTGLYEFMTSVDMHIHFLAES